MSDDAVLRAGYAAFNAMLKPEFTDPHVFRWSLTEKIDRYRGHLLMLGSQCSFMGYDYEQRFRFGGTSHEQRSLRLYPGDHFRSRNSW